MQPKFFKKNRQDGFTLVEVLVVITIFTFSGLIMTSLFLGHESLYRYYTTEVATGKNARLTMDRILGLSREAEAILPNHSFSGTTFTTGAETLVLRLRTIDASDNFVIGHYDYVVFYRDAVNPSQFFEQTEVDISSRRVSATRLLANNVFSLNFTYDSSDFNLAKAITVSLVTSQQFRNSTSTNQLTGQIKIRDKI